MAQDATEYDGEPAAPHLKKIKKFAILKIIDLEICKQKFLFFYSLYSVFEITHPQLTSYKGKKKSKLY